MLIALWITAILLTLALLAAGAMKIMSPKAKLEASMAWVADFSGWQVKAIGALEVLAGLGVILPLVTGIAPVMTAVAAIGFIVLQLGAVVVHLRREEPKVLPANIALIVLAATVAVLALAR